MNKEVKIIPFGFHKYFIFILITFNMIGLLNFPFYEKNIIDFRLYAVLIVSLTGYLTGYLASYKFFRRKAYVQNIKTCNKKKLSILFICLIAISFITIIGYNIYVGGIVITIDNQRFINPSFITLLSHLASIVIFYKFSEEKLRGNKIKLGFKFIIFLYILLLFSLGYRAPIVTLLGVLFVIDFSVISSKGYFKNLNLKKLISIGFLGLIFLSLVSLYRKADGMGLNNFVSTYSTINFNYFGSLYNPALYLSPSFALLRYDQKVVRTIINNAEREGFYYGKISISNLLTLLPGDQWGARNYVGHIVGARTSPNGKPWSITPTLQGALFIDGGYFYVFLGFFVIPFVMSLTKKLIFYMGDSQSLIFYSLLYINFLKSIHNGFFDISLFILICFLFGIHLAVSFNKINDFKKI